MNATAIADGVVATVNVIASQTSTLSVVNMVAASVVGGAVSLSGTGGAVTVSAAPTVSAAAPTLISIGCSPTALSGASSSACTVTLSGAVTVATAVTLSSNNTAVVIPQSVTVAVGSSSAPFSATSNGAVSASVTLTATLAGSSKTATLTVAPPAATLSSLSCTPTSLSGASSSSCTVALSAAATAATTVPLSSNNTAVTVPQSVTVSAGSSSASFTAISSSSLNATVTLTATLNGASKTTILALSTSTFSVRIHAGGAAYTDSQGYTWSADNGYTGGAPWSTRDTIANTNAVPLYQSVRYGLSGYQFSVPNGNYTVRLKFAEVSQSSIGQRVFTVTLNGSVVLPRFDIVAAAGGPLVPVDKSFAVAVTNGTIQIGFIRQVNDPMVNAIEIVQQGAPLSQTAMPPPTTFSPLYINAGGPAYFDPQGVSWAGDTAFTKGDTWSTIQRVTNTSSPTIYETCRYGIFDYLLPVPNGKYMVTLKFAEISKFGAGERQFNVQINGVPVLTNFDIIAAVGAPFVAIDETFSATVSNGVLVLGFTAGAADLPLINAIQVVSAN